MRRRFERAKGSRSSQGSLPFLSNTTLDRSDGMGWVGLVAECVCVTPSPSVAWAKKAFVILRYSPWEEGECVELGRPEGAFLFLDSTPNRSLVVTATMSKQVLLHS